LFFFTEYILLWLTNKVKRIFDLFLYYKRITRILDIGAYLHNFLILIKNKVGKMITFL